MNTNSLEFHDMNFNFGIKKSNKKNYRRNHYGKILTVRLPCNPIFPIGPIYLADHVHKILLNPLKGDWDSFNNFFFSSGSIFDINSCKYKINSI